MTFHTEEVNVKICKNLASDASVHTMEKVKEARAFLEGMIAAGAMVPGEYVISRKGLKGNGSGPINHGGDRYSHYHSTGEFGHTLASALKHNWDPAANWSGDHTSLWVNRVDGTPCFMTKKGHEKPYCALSTATRRFFTSVGI